MNHSCYLQIILILAGILFLQCCNNPGTAPEQAGGEPVISQLDTITIEDAFEPGPPQLSENRVYYLTVDKSGRFFACTDSGIFIPGDIGVDWIRVTTALVMNLFVAEGGDLMLASVPDDFANVTVYSTDSGQSWQEPAVEPSGAISGYFELPDGVLLALGSWHDESAGGLYRSTNRGENWEIFGFEFGNSIIDLAMSSEGRLYALVHLNRWEGPTKLYVSEDWAATWTEMLLPYQPRSALAISSSDAIYVASDSGLVCSADNGANWELVLKQHDPGYTTVYIDTENNVFLNSEDLEAGGSMIQMLAADHARLYQFHGFPETNVATIVRYGDMLYLADWGKQLYRSTLTLDELLSR